MTEQIKEVKKHVYHNRWDSLVVCVLSFCTEISSDRSCQLHFFVSLTKRNTKVHRPALVRGPSARVSRTTTAYERANPKWLSKHPRSAAGKLKHLASAPRLLSWKYSNVTIIELNYGGKFCYLNLAAQFI